MVLLHGFIKKTRKTLDETWNSLEVERDNMKGGFDETENQREDFRSQWV